MLERVFLILSPYEGRFDAGCMFAYLHSYQGLQGLTRADVGQCGAVPAVRLAGN